MTFPRASRLSLLFVCLLALCVVAFLLAAMAGGFEGAQSWVFFGRGDDTFSDLIKPCQYMEGLNPYMGEGSQGDMILPPLGFMMLYPLAKIMQDAPSYYRFAWVGASMASSAILLFYACFSLYRGPSRLRPWVLLGLSFSSVFLYAFERGNAIVLSAFFVAVFLLYYDSEKPLLKHLAFLCLAIAAGMKIFPALFGLLLLYEKRYKDAALLVAYGVVLSLVPIFFFEGGAVANFEAFLSNLALHAAKFKHRIMPRFGLPYLGLPWYYTYLRSMEWLSYAMAGASLVFLPLYQRKWQKLLLLGCLAVMMPVSSSIYNALYLFPILMIFLGEERPRPLDYVYAALLALMLSPYQLPVIPNQQANYCLALVWLLLLGEGAWLGLRRLRGRRAKPEASPV